MIEEVKLGRSCDSLRAELEEGVRMAAKVLTVQDSLIRIQREQIDLRDQATRVQTERVLNSQAESLELKKQVRKQKRLKFIAIALGVVVFLI